MARHDEEQLRVRADLLERGDVIRTVMFAVLVAALADEAGVVGVGAAAMHAGLDVLVEVAKRALVAGDALDA